MPGLTLTALLDRLRSDDVRVWEEDGQLRVQAPGGRLAEDLRQALREQKDDLLAVLRKSRPGAAPSIPVRPRTGDVPLSSAQRRLWFLEQLRADGASAYNLSMAFEVEGALDVPVLEQALADVLDRHEVLRTGIRPIDGQPRGILASSGRVSIQTRDVSAHPDSSAAFRADARRMAETAFDLDAPPLVRAAVWTLGPQRFGGVVVLHHLVADGESLPVLMHDWATCYADRRHGRVPALPALPLQYADFAAWQNERDDSHAERFWREQFPDVPTPLELPTDWPRPTVQSFAGDVVSFDVPAETMQRLHAVVRTAGASVFMGLLATTAVVLQRWAQQDDVTIGTPTRGRPLPELDAQVGCYVNTLALRCRVDRRASFADLLSGVRQTVTRAFDFESYPIDRVIDALSVPRDTGRSPLYDVMVSLAPDAPAPLSLEGVTLTPIDIAPSVSQLDLTWNFSPNPGGGLDATLQYRTDIFARRRMERLVGQFSRLLDGLTRDSTRPLREIASLSTEERRHLLVGMNDTAASYAGDATITGRFQEQVARTPDAVAVIEGERRWTYAEMDARSSSVAAALRGRGVGPEGRVAIMTLRGERMMVGLLGILKAGAAYVPVHPGDPSLRINALLADCRPALVLTEDQIAEWATQPTLDLLTPVDPDGLAYVIYTSGSTGRPKGVQISHGSVVNRILWMNQEYGFGPGDVVLQKTPYTFDVSVWELFGWAMSGATVAFLAPDAEKDPAAIVDAIETHDITLMHFVPSMLRAFLDHLEPGASGRLHTLRDVFASGEALPLDLVAGFQRQVTAPCGTRLHNLYGPTEATVDVSYFDCSRSRDTALVSSVPIGAPVANTQLYVLDRDFEPVALGVTGEIYIGGVNVGRGYLGRPDLTAERFVPDPWGHPQGCRLYRTGDLGRWGEDGELEYLGRNDQQVKVRGHRIELGEVESALHAHPDVTQAAVDVSREQLVAYVTVTRLTTIETLRDFLADRLPTAMIPARFIAVDTWPLTSSGKLDRRALAALAEAPMPGSGRPHVEPNTDTEQALAAIVARVLGVPVISVDDDFFERGGHSLAATRVIAHARQECGLNITLQDLFAHSTVRALAACADRREPVRGRPLVAVEPQAHYPVSHAQRRLWLAEQRSPGAAYNVSAAFRVSGSLDVEALTEAWRRLQRRHESLRTCFREVHGEPRQVIAENPDIRIDVAPLQGRSFEEEAARIAAVPFDLTEAPLVRMAIRTMASADSVRPEAGWIVVLHHIVCDGWSMPILVRELTACYEDARAGRATVMPALRVQYKDFASWQRTLVADPAIDGHRRYWHRQFASPPPRLLLPLGEGRPEQRNADPGRVVIPLDATRTTALQALGRAAGASLFVTLLTLVKALLFRYTGQTDITVGTVTAGRLHPDVERQIGFYVNTLALRSTIDTGESFSAFLARVRESTVEALDHQVYPFDLLVDDLDIRADGRFPLFDVMVVLQNNETAELRLPGLELRAVDLPASGNKFDLSFHFAPVGDGLDLTIEYRADRFSVEAVERAGAAFAALADAVLAEPAQHLGDLPLPAGAVQTQTLAVVSTFTAEPLHEPLAFWMERLGVPTQMAFAPFGQVFQEWLDPSSLIGRNRHGANICLLRLSDWNEALQPLVPSPARERLWAGHDTHTLPNGAEIAHLNAYETEDVYQEVFVDRVYARHGVTLRDGDVVLDIGANIGLFSLFAQASARDVTLYGFEPAPATFEALRRNMAVYCPGAQVFHCGIGGRDGSAPFTFYPKSSVFSSYHPDAAVDAAAIRAVVRNVVEREAGGATVSVADATDVFMADRLQAETVQVPMRSLSSIIREHGIAQIDLLKLDAEKSEREILDGLALEDWQKIRQVVIEVHDSDGTTRDHIERLLIGHGFRVVVEEEARLQASGLYTMYGRRDVSAGDELSAQERHVSMFCDAVRVAATRAPAVPCVIVSCPEAGRASEALEALLAEGLAGVPGVVFVPAAELARTYPVEHPFDPRADELGRVPYTAEMYAALATVIARRIEAVRRPPYKVVVLDADQTLWRGVLGEDGVEGISLDAPSRALQTFMLEQQRAGMVLCLCSKNADEDVVRAFASHSEMPLRIEDFVARRVNWQPKSENIRSLAGQLGVGLDSMVFVDDNPLECAEVAAGCPEVLTLCLPEAIERMPLFLRGTWAFDRTSVTDEDARRSALYAAEGERERVRAEAPSLEAFMAGLDVRIEMQPVTPSDLPRVAQLTQRTNQFNTTTVRRTEAEISQYLERGGAVSVVRVRDRFGDYGLVGVVLYRVDRDALIVDSLMLSCRALGRGVEHHMLATLGDEAETRGLTSVVVLFVSTAKNRPAADFLDRVFADGQSDDAPEQDAGDASERRYRMLTSKARAVAFVPEAAPEPSTGAGGDRSSAEAAPARRGGGAIESGLYDAVSITREVMRWGRSRGGHPARTSRSGMVPARTEHERALVALWSQLLGVDDVGTNESFFDLGGHSLKAIRMLSQAGRLLGVDLTISDLFANPTIAGLSARADTGAKPLRAAIPAARESAHYPLSGAQRRLWILSQMGGDGAMAYNVPAAFVLAGDLDVVALAEAFRLVQVRHESLRTRFIEVDGVPRQEIVANVASALTHDASETLTEREFSDRAAEMAHAPFDFGEAPLLRARLWPLDDRRWGLALVMHHVITDGWSMPILMRDLWRYYDNARQPSGDRDVSPAPALRIQYKDFAVWQQEFLASPAALPHQAYWHRRFQTPPPVLHVPTDTPRPRVQVFEGRSMRRRLDTDLADRVRECGADHGATLFMTLLAACDVLLYRYTGETDVTVGSPMTGRVHPDLEDQVGFFVNTLALRTRVVPRESFSSLLTRVRAETAEAFTHEVYPFDRLVEELRLPRDLGRSPLFDVMLVVDQDEQVSLTLSGIDVRSVPVRHDVSRFDLTFHLVETADGLELGLQYNHALFSRERVEAMGRHFEHVLRSAVADPSCAVADLAILDDAEDRALVVASGGGSAPRTDAADETLVDGFRAQVRRAPAGVALIGPDGEALTYQALDDRSDVIADWLLSRGVRAEEPVGVLAPRSMFTWAAMLGIMKAGAVYLPLDPTMPLARRDFMIADSRARIVLTPDFADDSAHGPAPQSGEPAVRARSVGHSLAYIIYTSGSTGQPKGVGVPHAALANMARDQILSFDLRSGDIIGQFSSVGFDASLYEAFLALLSGATLATVPDEARGDPRRFGEWATVTRPTVLVLPPAFVRVLERAPLPSVRLLVTAGEAPDGDDARHYAGVTRYVNAYGPTECAVCATTADVRSAPDEDISMGRPLANTSAYVLDSSGGRVPIGVVGELYLGGAGLARGYVGQPALTAAQFVPDSFSRRPGARLYRTGDLVRWRADGALEFMGRRDFQVKVRGHRIELGEIEVALRSHDTVRDCVVIARALDVVAYVVGTSASADALTAYLRHRLPEFMVPSQMVLLEALPLTPSGKVDRAALPAPGADRQTNLALERPATEVEQAIAGIWCAVLEVSQVSVLDNFFDLGGNSILLTRVLSSLRRDVAPHLTLLDLFSYPRIRDLAAHVTSQTGTDDVEVAARLSDRAARQRAALGRPRRPTR